MALCWRWRGEQSCGDVGLDAELLFVLVSTQDITLLNKDNKIFSQAHRYAIPHVPAAERASADKAGWGWAAAGRAAGGDSGEYVYEQVYG